MPILFPSAKAALAAAALSAFAATAGLTAASGHEGRHSATYWFGAPGKPTDVDRTIRVEVKDLSFVPGALQVNRGETVRFVVVNSSEVDHDFTIGDSRAQSEHRAEMAEMASMGGMATMHANHVDPNAVFLKARETKEIVWRFTKAGTIEYGCNVPGHYEAGMKGAIAIR